jgi:lipoyl(octanoyl) transferase
MTLEFSRLGLAPDFVDYMEGWDAQRELHDNVFA